MDIKKVLKNKPTVKIIFEVYEEDYCKWLIYKAKIEELIQQGIPVPTGILKKFLSYKVEKEHSKIHSLIAKYTDETMEYLSKKSLERYGYNFSIKETKPYNPKGLDIPAEALMDGYVAVPCESKIKNNKREHTYSLRGIVKQVLHEALMNDTNEETRNDKGKCIRFIYGQLSLFIDKLFTGKKKWATYKKSIVAGVIASRLGYLTKHEEFNDADYTAYIAKQMETYTKPLKRKKSLQPKLK